MTAIGLACLSAFLFGAMSVGLRMGLNRCPDVELATVATVACALVVATVAAAIFSVRLSAEMKIEQSLLMALTCRSGRWRLHPYGGRFSARRPYRKHQTIYFRQQRY